nr:hypothetical protein [Tanacetum cinerariifolium]
MKTVAPNRVQKMSQSSENNSTSYGFEPYKRSLILDAGKSDNSGKIATIKRNLPRSRRFQKSLEASHNLLGYISETSNEQQSEENGRQDIQVYQYHFIINSKSIFLFTPTFEVYKTTIKENYKATTLGEQEAAQFGSTMRIPVLYRGEYSQWHERFMNYLEEQTDGEAMIISIQNGDHPFPVVAQVSLAGTAPNAIPTLKDPNNETAKDLWDALERQMRGSEYGEQDRKAAILYEYENFKATEGEKLLDTYLRYLQVINDLKKCGYKKDNCELNYKFLNNLQLEWKQYGTLMRHTLYNILKQNQDDVNDALGYKKKAVVVTSDLLALVAEKTKVSKQKEKVDVQTESEGSDNDDISDLKKITALLAKAFNRKKYYAKPTDNNLITSSASSSANKKLETKLGWSPVVILIRKSIQIWSSWLKWKTFFQIQTKVLHPLKKPLLRKKIDEQEILFDKMSRELVEMNNNVLRLQGKILEKETKILELEGCQTSSLKPYVLTVILEKIIIDLKDEVVSLLEKEKANLQTIESLKSKGFESSENAISESENRSENDCQVVEKESDKMENSKNVENKTKRKRRKRKSSKQNDKQVNNGVPCANRDFVHFSDLDTFSSVRRPKHSGVIWKKKESSNTSNVDLSSISHSKLNKVVKRYSRKDLLSCNNSHLGKTSSAYVCNDAMNVSCNSRLYDSFDENNLFIFDDICLWIIDSGCSKHMTGNHALLTNFVEKFLGTVRFGNNDFAVIAGYADVIMKSSTTNVETSNVEVPSNEEEVFHESSESFQEESSSSLLNDDAQQSSEEVEVPSSNTQSVSNNMVPNVDQASTSHNEEVYVGQPSGFVSKQYPDHVYALDKALYGLKQEPQAWYDVLSQFLIDSDFLKGSIDTTLFIKKKGKHIMLIQIYVDDIIFESTNPKYYMKLSDLMVKRFEISMMGEMKFFLGLQVNQFSNGIFINQSKYIHDILKRFEMINYDTVPTPMVEQAKLKLDLVGKPVDHTDYRSMIGSLMYVTSSRPDIMFATCMCAKYQENSNEHHVSAVKRILGYLKGTINLGL